MNTLTNRVSIEQTATVATPSPSAVVSNSGAHARPQASAAPTANAVAHAAAATAAASAAAAPAESLKAVAAQIDSYLRSTNRELNFSVDKETGRAVITVRDAQTGDVIRQIPGDEAMRLAHMLGNSPSALIDLIV